MRVIPKDVPYCVSFDTKDMPGKIKSVRVELSTYVLGPNDSVRVDLKDHPLYPQLEAYVLANPSRKK